ncbi:MAG: aldehyde ferredoxin oxidoreductase N-terminal domain-containing protein, partial [Candidatus Helarchaeota archaeon]
MEYYGYAGKILIADLTNREFKERDLDIKEIKDFIGGFGLNVKLASEFSRPKLDPLSENNPIIIGTGPLVGTIVPGATRTVATTKFPASNAIANVCGAMSFGFHLKNSGYDNIVITGKADTPTILQVSESDPKFLDANKYWGKDVVETTDSLKEKYGNSGVIAMGQSGENLVKFALA